jgi:hypothetical protein
MGRQKSPPKRLGPVNRRSQNEAFAATIHPRHPTAGKRRFLEENHACREKK